MPGSALVLKGGIKLGSSKRKEEKEAKKRRREKKERRKQRKEASRSVGEAAAAAEAEAPKRTLGTGRFITSGTACTGQGTKFMDELSNGDALIITHPTTLAEEIRIVTMVLSNMSISLSSPFSSDLMQGTRFEFIKKPKDAAENEVEVAASKKRKTDDDKLKYGTYAGSGTAGKHTFTYRERKGGKNASGSYYVKTETLDHELSREELLDMRCKRKGDRHA